MAVEALVSAIVEKFVSSAADAIAGQLRAAWGLEEKLERLKRLLLRIQSVLAAAEEKQTVDTAVKAWLEALKKVAYEAEDVLDELNYETLRHKAAEVAGDKTPCMGEVRDFFSSHNPVLIRLRMGRKLNNLLQEMDQIARESATFNLSNVGLAQPEAAARFKDETCSFVEESKVVGRGREKDELVKMLIGNNGDAENVAVLPIVGMGGLGKTHMAQLIYNDPQVAGYFNLQRWVCVSDTWDVKGIIRKILSSSADETTTMEDLHQALRKHLTGTRFLIVLDDIWEEDPIKWNNLKDHLNCGGRGSAIIVTTRSDRVSEMTRTLPSCHLRYLSEDESWDLFSKRAFAPGDKQPEELVDIGKAIVSKCGGLPLALVMLGSLLKMERDKRQWQKIKDSGIWNTDTHILPALRLSYKHLPLHSKQCFAFCATFPKDYEMNKEKLINSWMAHGFIPSQGGERFEDKGNEIFNQLVQRSFLQDLKEEMKAISGFYIIRTSCRMHDLVHDLALSIAGNDCVAIQEGSSQYTVMKDAYHLFFSKTPGLDIKDVLKTSPYLRTIFMKWESLDALKDSGSTSLRVLAVGAIGARLPSSMKYPQHLRYLHLHDGRLSELPESICTLLNLQTLRLSDCWELQRLPERMACMISLRHLYLDDCDKLMKMPPGMGRMTNLQTLTLYVVSEETGRGIGELKDLHLSSRLNLRNLGRVKDAKEAREMNLHSKDLHVLSLDWTTGEEEGGGGEGEETSSVEEVLEELKPPSCLKLLEIRGYQGLNCPKWTADALLQNLQRLDLKECRGLHRLPPLWQLSSLEDLTLQDLDNLKYIISDNKAAVAAADDTTARSFRSLKTLELDGLGSLEEWWENRSNAMPNCFPALVDLVIEGCPELAGPIPLAPCLNLLDVYSSPKIPLGSVSALTSLVSLRFNSVGSLEEGRSTSVADDSFVFVPHETVALRNLQCLEILHIEGPKEIPLAWWLHEDENKDEKEEEKEEEEGSGHSSSLKVLLLDFQCDWIFSWPRYSGFWTSLASLERLWISECDVLVALPCEALQVLKSLRHLGINMCLRLKCLALEGLTALRSLTLEDCSDLTSLTSPEQVLATLKELLVRRCPQLQRKCETGGEYWSLVSNIPVLRII